MGPWEPKGLAPKGNVNPPSTEREKMVKLIFFFREGPNLTFSRKCKIEARKKVKSSQEKCQMHTGKMSNRNREMVKYTPL